MSVCPLGLNHFLVEDLESSTPHSFGDRCDPFQEYRSIVMQMSLVVSNAHESQHDTLVPWTLCVHSHVRYVKSLYP